MSIAHAARTMRMRRTTAPMPIATHSGRWMRWRDFPHAGHQAEVDATRTPQAWQVRWPMGWLPAAASFTPWVRGAPTFNGRERARCKTVGNTDSSSSNAPRAFTAAARFRRSASHSGGTPSPGFLLYRIPLSDVLTIPRRGIRISSFGLIRASAFGSTRQSSSQAEAQARRGIRNSGFHSVHFLNAYSFSPARTITNPSVSAIEPRLGAVPSDVLERTLNSSAATTHTSPPSFMQ
jgi:hypothetical protein